MPNEPDIVQKLSLDFNVVNNLDLNFGSDNNNLNVDFGNVYVVGGNCKVLYATTATWNSKPQLISLKGYIYIYSDYRKNSDQQNIASMKIGDGTSYLIDMPFADELLYGHVDDIVRHVSSQEREFWNNKVRCYVDPLNEQNLIFTTN